ncbi:MAG: hypothetical protein Q8M53_10790 [Burkholderiales bacterium]|nr:hypothetical protein [Burkholderiales bacterium]MDP3715481.1 hypothetical protein [Burkholderiales bacterium]
MNATTERWKIEMHGGGSRHQWREVAQAKPRQAGTQAQILIDRAKQGGVRVLNADGVIVNAWWRRHAPGARPQAIAFCIGCGCDDLHACIDPDAGGSCSWLVKEGSVGVCSCCVEAMHRWNEGDRALKVKA